MNGRRHLFLRLLVAAMLLQSLAGKAATMCIGPDHVGLAGESGHACCEHDGGAHGIESALMAFDYECDCIDIELPANPMQLKRPGCGSEFDAPRAARSRAATSFEIADEIAPAAPLGHCGRAARTTILRI